MCHGFPNQRTDPDPWPPDWKIIKPVLVPNWEVLFLLKTLKNWTLLRFRDSEKFQKTVYRVSLISKFFRKKVLKILTNQITTQHWFELWFPKSNNHPNTGLKLGFLNLPLSLLHHKIDPKKKKTKNWGVRLFFNWQNFAKNRNSKFTN